MAKDTLPTYAIVELLMRLAHINPFIGDYKNHTIYATGVLVKTTNGSITFSRELIMHQFHNPDQISDTELKQVEGEFKPANGKRI